MAEEHRTYVDRPDLYPVKRMSWGAIFAGVILVLIVQVTLSMIGLAVGLTTVDPVSEQDPAAGLATGAMIWWVVAGLIALFFGAWAAARMSAAWTRTNGMLHGIVLWGFVELLFIYLLTSAVGAIIGGAFGIVENTLSAAPKLIPDVNLGKMADKADVDVPWQQIQNEVKQILRQTGQEELSPDQLQQEAQQAQETVEEAAGQAVRQPQQAYDEIMQALDKLLRQAKDVASEVDRQAVVNVLVQRTDMSEQEAEQTVDRWIKTYRQAAQQVAQSAEQMKKEVVQTAEEVGEEAADVGAEAAWWSSLMLILGALVAGIGGALGVPASARERVARTT